MLMADSCPRGIPSRSVTRLTPAPPLHHPHPCLTQFLPSSNTRKRNKMKVFFFFFFAFSPRSNINIPHSTLLLLKKKKKRLKEDNSSSELQEQDKKNPNSVQQSLLRRWIWCNMFRPPFHPHRAVQLKQCRRFGVCRRLIKGAIRDILLLKLKENQILLRTELLATLCVFFFCFLLAVWSY